MKRTILISVLALALVALLSGVAMANFGTHGGYVSDTDECAGCHRAHTAFSTVARTDYFPDPDEPADPGSALLISNATTMEQFCLACHGDDAPGAATNVESGVFDAGPSSDVDDDNPNTNDGADLPGVTTIYDTDSVFNTTLNGGAFRVFSAPSTTANPVGPTDEDASGVIGDFGTERPMAVSSNHTMEAGGIMWGYGASTASATDASLAGFTCTNCHNPHGSSNYRLLRDEINGVTVGGYDAADVPQPFVVSAETEYPNGWDTLGTIGWYKGYKGEQQKAAYVPNYTTPYYKQSLALDENMSVWCAACHTQYVTSGTAWDYEEFEESMAYTSGGVRNDDYPATGSVGDAVGNVTRYRHPVNITLQAGRDPQLSLANEVELNAALPLEQNGADDPAAFTKDFDYFIGCLTCHYAHGTTADMAGYADAELYFSPTADAGDVNWLPSLISTSESIGVNPTFSSALLRTNNRGVCERCHNK